MSRSGAETAASDIAVGRALLRLGARLDRLQVENLDALSIPLSMRQFRILERIHDGVTSVRLLAELANRQPSTISKSVDSLVRQGLVTRVEAAEDRRVIKLALTDSGLALWTEAREAADDLSRRILDETGVDKSALMRMVGILYEQTELIGIKTEGPAPDKFAEAPSRPASSRTLPDPVSVMHGQTTHGD